MALRDRATNSGSLDGAWWPNSTDLRTELPDLVAILSLSIGAVYRVVYDPAIWPHALSRIIRGKAQISVDPYSMLASDTIYQIGTHSRDAVLYLVPPRVARTWCTRLLRLVSTATQPMSVDTLRQLATYFAASDNPAMQ